MFKKFEVRPVVLSEIGEVTPCMTFAEAVEYAEETEGIIAFGLYGMGNDGLWQHIADTTLKEGMIELVSNLLAINLQWKNRDRLEFSRNESQANKIMRELLEELHPGVVCLIGNHHGQDRSDAALAALAKAKDYLVDH